MERLILDEEDLVRKAKEGIYDLPPIGTHKTPDEFLSSNCVSMVTQGGDLFLLSEYDKDTDEVIVYYEKMGEGKNIAREKLSVIFEHVGKYPFFVLTMGNYRELYNTYERNIGKRNE